MTVQSTSINIIGDITTAAEPVMFVTLEQEDIPPEQKYIARADIYRMFQRAIDGLSAHKYKPGDCPVIFDGDFVKFWYDFYAMPSSKDLAYGISVSIGEIGEIKVEELTRGEDIIFEMTDNYQLDFLPTIADLQWQTGCWKRGGEEVPPPELNIDGTLIDIGQELFGVARFVGKAFARKYRLNVVIEKGDNAISGIDPVVIASWYGVDGVETEELQLETPECVKFALSLCDGDAGDYWCDNSKPTWPVLYYSTCDGSIITTREGEDVEGWCGEI